MAEHQAKILWKQGGGEFMKGKYSREHTWTFDGGAVVPASSSPHSVRPPLSNEANVDPEEALVAALSSCHMLTFLWLAYRGGFEISEYEDDALGTMTKNERGVPWMSTVTLRPRIAYVGARPTPDQEAKLHHDAHEQCYIAQSVKSEILVQPVAVGAAS